MKKILCTFTFILVLLSSCGSDVNSAADQCSESAKLSYKHCLETISQPDINGKRDEKIEVYMSKHCVDSHRMVLEQCALLHK